MSVSHGSSHFSAAPIDHSHGGGRAKSGSKGCKGASEGERYVGGRGMLPTQQTDRHGVVFQTVPFAEMLPDFSLLTKKSSLAMIRGYNHPKFLLHIQRLSDIPYKVKMKIQTQTSEVRKASFAIFASWHLKLIKQLHFNFRFPPTSHFTYPSLSLAIFRPPIYPPFLPPSLITMRTSGGQRDDMREGRADGRRGD